MLAIWIQNTDCFLILYTTAIDLFIFFNCYGMLKKNGILKTV